MATSSWINLKERISDTYFANVKSLIFITTLAVIGGLFLVNWFFLNTIRNQYKEVTDKEARLYAAVISEDLKISEKNWVFAKILRTSKYPIIITDKNTRPVNWKNIHPGVLRDKNSRLNENVKFLQLSRQDRDFLRGMILKLDKKNDPLRLENDDQFLGYLHYGELQINQWLSLLPILEILVLVLFVFAGYFGFLTLRKSEQSALWVALAKETAHQMGTPLSALMGWMEYLKLDLTKNRHNEKLGEILEAMDGDISRLKKVSNRFSQIGSSTKFELGNLNELCKSIVEYFTNRLPQLGKKIDMKLKLEDIPEIWVNYELISWVLENLVKNALDSIKNKNGLIEIETFYAKDEKTVHITVTDNGKGIGRENWEKVFQTGYSTKKRGWGLGLSLAKRIITIYHGGKIKIEWSSKYHGTKFRIILPVFSNQAKKEINEEWKKTNPVG